MSERPSGTVTLLFTDIQGSTRLLDEFGDRYADVLAEHRRVVRAALSRHGGVEVDTQGDAFFVAFERARDAVATAGEVQAELAGGPVRVRVGSSRSPCRRSATRRWSSARSRRRSEPTPA